ncbi:hypothetical protein FRACA_1840008 [Frankia canadensis]|uniref:Uncharacterized protein n=1 Tax=Frankia canadensis TaxID=1836972 RepID=A0A2I2KNY4_9ACTN|nr:hypothetical protein FRACA_1840008 [Frankia canadensis]SOU54642.1 hypothetical protein FRACA_1840008 [Frankia canadensis]
MMTSGLFFGLMVILAGLGAPGLVCLAVALAGFTVTQRALSRLVVVYGAMVTLNIAVAGRVFSANTMLPPGSAPAEDGFADTCAALHPSSCRPQCCARWRRSWRCSG